MADKINVKIILALGILFSLAFMTTQIMVVDSMQLLERGYMFT